MSSMVYIVMHAAEEQKKEQVDAVKYERLMKEMEADKRVETAEQNADRMDRAEKTASASATEASHATVSGRVATTENVRANLEDRIAIKCAYTNPARVRSVAAGASDAAVARAHNVESLLHDADVRVSIDCGESSRSWRSEPRRWTATYDILSWHKWKASPDDDDDARDGVDAEDEQKKMMTTTKKHEHVKADDMCMLRVVQLPPSSWAQSKTKNTAGRIATIASGAEAAAVEGDNGPAVLIDEHGKLVTLTGPAFVHILRNIVMVDAPALKENAGGGGGNSLFGAANASHKSKGKEGLSAKKRRRDESQHAVSMHVVCTTFAMGDDVHMTVGKVVLKSGDILGVMVEIACVGDYDDKTRANERRCQCREQFGKALASLDLELRPVDVDYEAYDLAQDHHSAMRTGLRYSKLCDYLYKHREEERKSGAPPALGTRIVS